MRLNGKAAIMAHLGKRAHNTRGWYEVRAQYGHLIYCKSPNGKMNRGYWALSHELDEWDKQRCPSVLDVDLAKLAKEETTWEQRTSYATASLKKRIAMERELVPV